MKSSTLASSHSFGNHASGGATRNTYGGLAFFRSFSKVFRSLLLMGIYRRSRCLLLGNRTTPLRKTALVVKLHQRMDYFAGAALTRI